MQIRCHRLLSFTEVVKNKPVGLEKMQVLARREGLLEE
jgi:hypothetical protein